MINLLRAESYKLKRSFTFWSLVISILLISAFMHYLIVIDWWVMTGTPFEQVGLAEWNALAIFIIPLFFHLLVSTLAGFFIATEFSQQSVIKNQLTSGNKRIHIFFAKYIIFTIGALFVTVILPFMTAFTISFIYGEAQIFTTEVFSYLTQVYGLFIFHFLSITLLIFIIALVTEDSGRTILFSLLIAVGMFVIEKFVTIPWVMKLYEYTVFYQLNVIFKLSLTTDEIVQTITIGGITFLCLLFIGYVIFQSKEVK